MNDVAAQAAKRSKGSRVEQQRYESFNIKREITRLARFGANIVDAHSCFILLPAIIFERFAGTLRLGSPTIEDSYRRDVDGFVGERGCRQ